MRKLSRKNDSPSTHVRLTLTSLDPIKNDSKCEQRWLITQKNVLLADIGKTYEKLSLNDKSH